MTTSNKTYTYRSGQKIELEKSPDQMVVRALPENLDDAAIITSEQVSLFQLTNHTGMNPVKLVVKLMEDEPLVEIAEHDLNQRMNAYQFTKLADPEKMHKADPNHSTAFCGVICAEIDTVLTVGAAA